MPEERLVDYLYQELDGTALDDARQHIAGCAECQEALAGMGQTAQLLRAWRDEEPPVKLVFSQRWAPSHTRSLLDRLPGAIGSRFAWGVLSGVAAVLALMALFDREPRVPKLQDPTPPLSSEVTTDRVTQDDLKALQQTMLAQIAQMLEASEQQHRDGRHGATGEQRPQAGHPADTSAAPALGEAPGTAPAVASSAAAAELPATTLPTPAQAPRLPKAGPQVTGRPQAPQSPGGALSTGAPTLR